MLDVSSVKNLVLASPVADCILHKQLRVLHLTSKQHLKQRYLFDVTML